MIDGYEIPSDESIRAAVVRAARKAERGEGASLHIGVSPKDDRLLVVAGHTKGSIRLSAPQVVAAVIDRNVRGGPRVNGCDVDGTWQYLREALESLVRRAMTDYAATHAPGTRIPHRSPWRKTQRVTR